MRYLVVGYGAREYAIAKRLKEEGHRVSCFLTKPNAGLMRLTRGCHFAERHNPHEIIRYARTSRSDCIVIGNEEPLFEGLVDLASQNKIPAYGPTKEAARLEWDKEFAKGGMREVIPALVGTYESFASVEETKGYIKTLKHPIVAKSGIVEGGRGIVVIKNPASLSDSELTAMLRKIEKGRARILVEDYHEGEDFSIYCFVDAQNCFFSRALKDYPFRLGGDRGKKTGGMGATSDVKPNLPFMTMADYEAACEYVRVFLEHMKKTADLAFRGMLSAQFFKTKSGLKFNEFDARPGDPEIINILETLETNFSELIEQTCTDRLVLPSFSSDAAVAIYFVPRHYPDGKVRALPVSIDFKGIDDNNCRLYYANMEPRGKRLLVTGPSRSLAIASKGRTIEEARANILKASGAISKTLEYRKDIGAISGKEMRSLRARTETAVLETPLVHVERLSGKYNCDLHLKLEYFNPTGTHKDRESRAVVSDAINNGFERIGIASTGNAGISLAYYALVNGLECTIFVSKNIDQDKLKLLKALKARIIVADNYDKAFEESGAYFIDNGLYDANPGSNLVRSIGDEQIGKEIARINPEIVVVPLNNGTLIHGIWNGLNSAGRDPLMVGACTEKSDIASSIAGLHLRERGRIERLEERGRLIKVQIGDPDIIAGLKELAVEDVFAEPSSAIVVGALNKVDIKGKVVCCVITGSGIRFPQQFKLLE